METLRLIPALVLGLLASSDLLAIEQADPLSVNGFVSATVIDSQNRIQYPNREFGISASYQINQNFSINASSLSKTGNALEIDTAFVNFESKLFDSEFTTDVRVGKNRTYLGLSNYSRFYPASRTFIILPQGIYWAPMDGLVGSSNGVVASIRHQSGFAFQFNKSKTDIENSKPITESTFIPGVISKSDIDFIGLTYSDEMFNFGFQKIRFKFTTDQQTKMFKHPVMNMELYFAKIHDSKNELALEVMRSSTSLNKLDNNDSWQESYSATYSHVLSESTKISVNYNRTSYNHEQELASKPGEKSSDRKDYRSNIQECCNQKSFSQT